MKWWEVPDADRDLLLIGRLITEDTIRAARDRDQNTIVWRKSSKLMNDWHGFVSRAAVVAVCGTKLGPWSRAYFDVEPSPDSVQQGGDYSAVFYEPRTGSRVERAVCETCYRRVFGTKSEIRREKAQSLGCTKDS